MTFGAIERWVRNRPGTAALLAMLLALFLWYYGIFRLMDASSPGDDLGAALINSATAMLGAAAIATTTRRHIVGRPFAHQAAMHAVSAILFALYWYFAVIVLLGWMRGSLDVGFFVRPFIRPVVAWQMFQSFALYAAVAAIAVALEAKQTSLGTVAKGDPQPPAPAKLLVKSGDELRAIELEDVVCIRGSDDYSEVCTPSRRHLARRSLAEFEKLLPPTNFVRVHRSCIVNLDHLSRAEPAGNGRLTLHMGNGDAVVASRAGTRLLRARSV